MKERRKSVILRGPSLPCPLKLQEKKTAGKTKQPQNTRNKNSKFLGYRSERQSAQTTKATSLNKRLSAESIQTLAPLRRNLIPRNVTDRKRAKTLRPVKVKLF